MGATSFGRRHNMTNKSNRRQYTCTECHKSFSRTNTLANHKRTHSGEKPFSCNVCGRVFTNLGNMRIHLRIHTGERPFKCTYCDKSFTQNGSLKAHLRIHTKEKPYSCKFCEKTFRVQANLKKHLVVHSEELPYECEVCEKRFKLKPDLKRHRRNVHSLNDSQTTMETTSNFSIVKTEEFTSPNVYNENQEDSKSYFNLSTVVFPAVENIKVEPVWDNLESHEEKPFERANTSQFYCNQNQSVDSCYASWITPVNIDHVKRENEYLPVPIESTHIISAGTLDMEALRSVNGLTINYFQQL